ncbi:hypothetical protein FRC10_001066 [Ceratobasidium sp. 414]|nr:hypothetical protein FRC10_001066 [Ceratobasidium sp. 414]
MSVAVLPAATGGPDAHNARNLQLKLDYWSALLPLVAQGVIAHQSAQRQQQLADACSGRRHPSLETTNAAQRATAQALLHKGEFEASVRALAEVTPDGLVSLVVTSLEAKVDRVAERAEHHDRWLSLVEESTTRIEKANKSAEDERSRATAQLTKSYRQLEGKVSQLSSSARAPTNTPPDPRISVAAHQEVEKRLASVDAAVGDFATKLEQQSKALADAQRKAQDLNAKVETLAGDLAVSRREAGDTRAKVEPLLPLATKAEALLSSLDSSKRFSEELEEMKSRHEITKVRLEVVSDVCKRAIKGVEDLRNDEIAPLVAIKADIAGMCPLKDHISALVKVPNTLDTIRDAVTGLAPLKDYINALIPLAAQSESLLSIASQQEQTARTLRQLESDVLSCMNDVPENRLGLGALETRVKGIEAWQPVIDQQKEVAREQDRLKGILERQEKTTRVYTDAQNRNARDLETVKAGLRQLEATSELNKNRSMRSELVEINNRISQIEDNAQGTEENTNSSMEQIQQEAKNMQSRISVFDRLRERVQALAALSDQSESLVSLPSRFAQLSSEMQDLVRQNLVDCKAEGAAASKEYSQSHERIKITETGGWAPGEGDSGGAAYGAARSSGFTSPEGDKICTGKHGTNRALVEGKCPHGSTKGKSLEGLQNRATTEKQRAQQLEMRALELQRDSSAALEATTKLQTFTKALKHSIEAVQTRLDPLEPLKDHIGALVSVADRHVQLVLLAQNLKQAQVCFAHADNIFLACHATKAKVESLEAGIECLNKRQDPAEIVEALAAEVGTLRPLVDRVAKVEGQTALFPEQYALLETVDKVHDKVSKWESDHKVLQGKLSSSTKSLRTEAFELKTKAEDALRVANDTAQSVEQLLPLKSHVAALTDLSGRSEQLLALGKQEESTEVGMVKLFAAHEKGNRRYGEMTDSMGMLRQTVEGLEHKIADMETDMESLGQDLKDEKAVWVTKIHAVETEISRLSHPEQLNNALIGLVTPSESPMSPIQRAPSTPDSRIALLERFAESARRELKNIAQNLTRIDNKMDNFKEQLANTNGRLAEHSAPVQICTSKTDGGAFSPLLDHVPALVALASQEAALRRMCEHAKTLTGIVHQVNGLDSDLKDLNSRVPAAEQFRLMTEFLADVPSLKKLMPLCGQVEPILSLAGRVEAFSPLAGHVKSLMPLVQRVERVEPLVFQVEKLSPLPSQIAELQASVTELQTTLAESGARSQPNTLGQPHSPYVEQQQLPPISFLPQPDSPPAMLLPSPDIESSPQRPSKKRKLEDIVESLEERLDSMRNEVDGVVWDMAEIEKQVCSPKRARMSGPPLPTRESGGIAESDSQYDYSGLNAWREQIDKDLDRVQRVVLELWQGEGGWPEKLEAGLEVAWAKSLMLREDGDNSTGLAIVRLLNTTRSDMDVIKLAVESQGPGAMVSGAASADAVVERIIGQVLERIFEHHTKFKTELEEWLARSTKPVKDMCRALRMVGGELE